jgi:thiamine transporter
MTTIPPRLGELGNDLAERTIKNRRPLKPEPDNTGVGINMKEPFKSSTSETRILSEAIVFIALAEALYTISNFYVPFLHLPQGGSVTLGSMVPLLWFALRRGPRWGIEAGIVYGLVHLTLWGEIVYPTQIVLDYPLAFGALGLAGAFKSHPMIGVAVGMTGRFIFHFISGVVFFGQYAWAGWNVYAYSGVYNASYLVPEFIISTVIIYLLLKRNLLYVYM